MIREPMRETAAQRDLCTMLSAVQSLERVHHTRFPGHAGALCGTPAVGVEAFGASVERTLYEDPPAATYWTLRSMAKAKGLAPSTIHHIWREHGLKPHRAETSKLSYDPKSSRGSQGP